jgi:deoxyribose-phosphate aldolase
MQANVIARTIDHTILKAEATAADVRMVVAEAIRYKFASVCVNPYFVRLVSDLLEHSPVSEQVKTCAVVGFPLGVNKTMTKAIEASSCVKDGAQEVDMVVNLPALLSGDLHEVRQDIMEVVRASRAVWSQVKVKVILETAVLDEAQIALGCRAAQEGGADFVKTSTGFHPKGGATVQTVTWLRKYAGPLQVKASGGIRDLATAVAMLQAGADRLGCSAGVAIVTAAQGQTPFVPGAGY